MAAALVIMLAPRCHVHEIREFQREIERLLVESTTTDGEDDDLIVGGVVVKQLGEDTPEKEEGDIKNALLQLAVLLSMLSFIFDFLYSELTGEAMVTERVIQDVIQRITQYSTTQDVTTVADARAYMRDDGVLQVFGEEFENLTVGEQTQVITQYLEMGVESGATEEDVREAITQFIVRLLERTGTGMRTSRLSNLFRSFDAVRSDVAAFAERAAREKCRDRLACVAQYLVDALRNKAESALLREGLKEI